jgi:predicted DNA binding CopG/RHH family protein
MEVILSPELEAKLKAKAAQQGLDIQTLVREALEHLVTYDEWFFRQVQKA